MVTKKTTVIKTKKPSQKVAVNKTRPNKYFEASGGRKSSMARVRLFTKSDSGLKISVNGRDYKDYFKVLYNQAAIIEPLKAINLLGSSFLISVHVSGGGSTGQADAIKHALAKVLIQLNPNYRKPL